MTRAPDRSPEGTASDRGCYAKGVELLARRAHFAAELAHKLTSRAFAPEEVAEAIERLTARGYLDDGETARGFVAERRRRSGWGSTRLRAELARRGAPAGAIAAALAELPAEQEAELARQTAERWRRRGGDDPAALARHLQRKGFSPHVILPLLGDTATEE